MRNGEQLLLRHASRVTCHASRVTYMLKTILFLVFFLFLIILNVSCNNSEKKSVLILSLRADPVYLNPVLAHEVPSMMVNQWIFNSLVRLDENLRPVPDLADKWQVSEDGEKIVFYLKKNVTWHDGYAFTAKDVKFTLDLVLSEKTNTYNRGLFMVDDKPVIARVIDEYTVEITMAKPFAPLLANLSVLGMVPEHILKDHDVNLSDFNSSPVGTGPFKFKEWKVGELVTLSANDRFFRGKPSLEEVAFRIIPSTEGRLIALETGQIDVGEVPQKDYERMSKFRELNIYRWYDLSYYYLGFDLTNPLFANREIRKALNYAVDREKIISSVLMGYGKVATGPIPSSSWAYDSDVERYEYNPDMARAIFKQQGWIPGKDGVLMKDDKKFSFTIHYGQGSENSEKVCIYIQHFLKEAGVEVKIRPVEFSVLVTEIANPGKFEGILLDWIENPDPDCFVEWGSDQVKHGMNFMSYSNSEVDTLLQEARTTMDINKRKELYRKFQKIITEDAPYIFLWYSETMIGVNRRIENVSKPSPAGLFLEPEKIKVVKSE